MRSPNKHTARGLAIGSFLLLLLGLYKANEYGFIPLQNNNSDDLDINPDALISPFIATPIATPDSKQYPVPTPQIHTQNGDIPQPDVVVSGPQFDINTPINTNERYPSITPEFDFIFFQNNPKLAPFGPEDIEPLMESGFFPAPGSLDPTDLDGWGTLTGIPSDYTGTNNGNPSHYNPNAIILEDPYRIQAENYMMQQVGNYVVNGYIADLEIKSSHMGTGDTFDIETSYQIADAMQKLANKGLSLSSLEGQKVIVGLTPYDQLNHMLDGEERLSLSVFLPELLIPEEVDVDDADPDAEIAGLLEDINEWTLFATQKYLTQDLQGTKDQERLLQYLMNDEPIIVNILTLEGHQTFVEVHIDIDDEE